MLERMLVPRVLRIEGVAFPLSVSAGVAVVSSALPELVALQTVLVQLCAASAPPELRERFARGEDFVEPALAAVRMQARDDDAGPALRQWRAFARAADTTTADSEIYLVSASFARVPLAVPRAIMAQLAAELVRLNDELRAGQRTAQLEPVPAGEPELSAGGPAWPTTAPTPDDDDDDDGDTDDDDDEDTDGDDAGDDRAAHAAQPGAGPAAQHLSDELLRSLEDDAAVLDQLDPEDTLRAGLPPEQVDALTAARRRTVLLGLRVAGLLQASTDAADNAALRQRLQAAGLLTLLGYLDAAAALRAYLGSDARARFFRDQAPPQDLLQSDVSLDWFRKASPPPPPGVTAHEWLALCEINFVRSRGAGPRAGRTYVKLEGRGTWLLYRTDVGPHLSLWRAL